jgi:tetratricopeptide (TPR) repeat protein
MFEGDVRLGRDDKRRVIAAVIRVDEADAALKAGDIAGALSLYRSAIALCPPCRTRGDFRVILGGHLFDQGEAAAAEGEFRAALAEGCGYPYEALRRLAFACAAQGDFDAAVEGHLNLE